MSARSLPTASPRRQARHPKVAHLIAADENALAELEALVATLPLCATGRIFIEVPDDEWIGAIDAPPRMTVTWLSRSRRSGAMGTARRCAPGQALARAVTAWSDEMLCAEDAAHTSVDILTGYLAAADIVEHLLEIGHPVEAIHAPAAYGLLVD